MIALLLLATVLTAAAFYSYRYLALKMQWFDVPNDRSSHIFLTPSGAGLALALVFDAVVLLAMNRSVLGINAGVFSLVASSIALVGWLDDRYSLPRRLRAILFAVYALAFSLFCIDVDVIEAALTVFFLFAFVNVFNFMDGIDGIAASESGFYFLVVGLLLLYQFGSPDSNLGVNGSLAFLCLLLAGQSGVFLFWNWAPAKLFLGDAGSLFLGLMIASVAVTAHVTEHVHILTSLIFLAVFINDSGVALLQRLFEGQRVVDAHRTHVYQLLSRRWMSHPQVVFKLGLVNFMVLLPLGLLSHCYSEWRLVIFLLCYGLLCVFIGILRKGLLSSSLDKI